MQTREALLLVSHGVPFDIAFAMDDVQRFAWCIIFKEIEEPIKFNFHSRKFEEIKS